MTMVCFIQSQQLFTLVFVIQQQIYQILSHSQSNTHIWYTQQWPSLESDTQQLQTRNIPAQSRFRFCGVLLAEVFALLLWVTEHSAPFVENTAKDLPREAFSFSQRESFVSFEIVCAEINKPIIIIFPAPMEHCHPFPATMPNTDQQPNLFAVFVSKAWWQQYRWNRHTIHTIIYTDCCICIILKQISCKLSHFLFS